ncbi:MAG: type II toxin-antitoxin system prevent-host-death family antitoxin [Candidatus Gottesmanbacteria bacterium]|nr:type II toxin-antitoxin system prevent-host-death family antitoxin [Candidatus Gottesmanbacteria bacterium]
MIQTLPITKAREDLTTLVDNARLRLDEYIITVNGYPAAVLMSVAEYDSLKETNEILDNPQLMAAIKEGEEDIRMNRVHDWKEVKEELKIDVQRKTYRTGQKRVKKHL